MGVKRKPPTWSEADKKELARLVRKYGREDISQRTRIILVPGQRKALEAIRTQEMIEALRALNRRNGLPDTLKEAEHTLYELVNVGVKKSDKTEAPLTKFRKQIKKQRLRGKRELRDAKVLTPEQRQKYLKT